MTIKATIRPVVLCILDGWGHGKASDSNAIALADTPAWDGLLADNPHSLIDASGGEVGLPDGQMGNSEVGHMNIGAGRVMMQDLPRINATIADGRLAAAPALVSLIDALKTSGGTCHLMGLLSPGGVHSHQAHIVALAEILSKAGIPVAIHAMLDGRDTPPRSAEAFMTTFLADIDGLEGTSVASVSGRYYAMDRDKRWDRSASAYAALVDAEGARVDGPVAAIQASYAADLGDEFMLPTVIGGYTGMADGDGLLMANFRADRARQILGALLDPAFDGFPRARTVAFSAARGMVEYSSALAPLMDPLFPTEMLENTLGAVISDAGMTQLRAAETEKYAHVTFFLNGGREAAFAGEQRALIPSPKVATYDLQPEMSAPAVADAVVEGITGGAFDLIVVNFANTDMVGHTGMLDAAIKAVETVDWCLGRIAKAVDARNGALLITADHGNAEQMTDPDTGAPHTAHSINRVPLVIAGAPAESALDDGRLADIAPTVLALLGLEQPAEMSGRCLLDPAATPARQAVG
jgi:2,3-bisphosphoglycerate-independent phosphoglycerate mutase